MTACWCSSSWETEAVSIALFCSLSLVVSELFCNFAASKAFPLFTPAPSSVSAFAILLLSGRAFFAKSLAVSKFCCTFAADKGSDFADAPAISAEWCNRKFWTFFDLCFLDRTLANLQGVLLDGRHPFLRLVNLVFQVIRFFQWPQSALTDAATYTRSAFWNTRSTLCFTSNRMYFTSFLMYFRV